MRPLLRAASAGETASAANTEPATIAAAKLPGVHLLLRIRVGVGGRDRGDADGALGGNRGAGPARDVRATVCVSFGCGEGQSRSARSSGVEKTPCGWLGDARTSEICVRGSGRGDLRDARAPDGGTGEGGAARGDRARADRLRRRFGSMGGRGQRCVRVGDGGWCQPGERTTLDETDATRAGVSRGSFPHRAPAGRPQRQ